MVEDVWDYYGIWLELLLNAEWWQEVETTTALDLEVLWDYNGLIANLLSCGLEMNQDDIWSLYIVRRLDSFKKNVYVLQLLQVGQKGPWWQIGPDKWGDQIVEIEKINSRGIPHNIW